MSRLQTYRDAYRARPRWQHVLHILAIAWLPLLLSFADLPGLAILTMLVLGLGFFVAFPYPFTVRPATPEPPADPAASPPTRP